jgi:thiamine biosynthesis lipoprotein
MIIPALFVAALFAVVILRQPDGPGEPEVWVTSGPSMGTHYTVKVVPSPSIAVDSTWIERDVHETIEAVNLAMSTWLEDSELGRFNRHGAEPFAASRELTTVMFEAQRVARASTGAFDITVGPLVDAWGFGPAAVDAPPSASVIETLLADTGYELLEVDVDRQLLVKKHPELRCDLSAIAKGYAVDLVAERLNGFGVEGFMVEIGGEVRTAGHNADGEPWRIGVELPSGIRSGVWSAVELVDAAMATSGDYRNYYEHEGVRISHTLDPRTGRPISHALASVTVIHPSCMTADAFATALNVLGPEDGRALVEREGLAALFLIRSSDGGFDEWASDAWRDLGANIPAASGVGPDVSE